MTADAAAGEQGPPDPDPVERLVQHAKTLDNLRRWEQADELLSRALAIEPGNEDALFLRAEIREWRQGRSDEAVDIAGNLLALYPDSARHQGLMARLRWRQGDNAEAEPYAREAVRLDPDSGDAHEALGMVLSRLPGRGDDARAAFAKAISLDPESPDIRYQYAMALYRLGEYKEAEAAFRVVLARRPNDAQCRSMLSIVLQKQHRLDEAGEELLAGLAADPDAIPQDLIVVTCEFLGLAPGLVEVYRRCCAALGEPDLREPGAAGDDPELLQRQAELALRLCDALGHGYATPDLPRRIDALVDAVLAADSGHKTARLARVVLLHAGGRYRDALEILMPLLDEGNTYDDCVLDRAIEDSRALLGHAAEGLAVARQHRERRPDAPEPRWWEAYFLLELGEVEAGLAAAQGLAAASPDSEDLHYLLGRAYFQAGDPAAAEPVLLKAVEVYSKDGDSLTWLAQLHHDQGRAEEAAEFTRRAAAIQAWWPTERRLLADLRSARDDG